MSDRHPRPLWAPVCIPALLTLATCAAGDPPEFVVTDAQPSLAITDARVREGNLGQTLLVFTANLSGPPGGLATVKFTTLDGTAAAADDDFDAASGQLEFFATDTVRGVEVVVHGDLQLEGNEWLILRLSDPSGVVLADSEAVGTITNDDRAGFFLAQRPSTIYTAGTVPNGWGDYDGDGFPDLPLYRSSGDGRLEEIQGFRQVLAEGNYHGVAWSDYDRDHDLDLAILGYSAANMATPTPSRLLRNDRADGFVDVAPAIGMDIIGSAETAVWGDFDGDGWPDLFAPYYSHIYPYQSFLYRNNGDGTFTERAAAAGVDLPFVPGNLRPEGAQAFDWNDDGYLDLYCASHLFENNGRGDFVDVREVSGLPLLFDEGAASVDYDNDGDFDLYLRTGNGPRLFRNDAGHFSERTVEAGLPFVPLLWGDSWADADGDGDLDLLLMPPGSHARLFLNQGDGTFERDAAFDLGEVPADLSAWGDCDRDGDVDLVVGSGYVRQICQNRLEELDGFDRSYLSVRVVDDGGYETMHGATVRLRQVGGPPGTTQTRSVGGGCSYLGQNEYLVRFGGVGSGRYDLEVIFPSPAGSRIVVDGQTNPVLWSMEPSQMPGKDVTIRRDGEVAIAEPFSRAVPRMPVRPAHLLGEPLPSPARSAVSIPFAMAEPGDVAVVIYDVHGRLLRRLDSAGLSVGMHSAEWDLRDGTGALARTGVYFCQLLVGGISYGTRRLLVIR